MRFCRDVHHHQICVQFKKLSLFPFPIALLTLHHHPAQNIEIVSSSAPKKRSIKQHGM